MELQIMAPPVANLMVHHDDYGGARPSTCSCHHVCKHGGTHEFEEKESKKKKKSRKQQPVMVKVRSVFRRRAEDSSTADKTSSVVAGNAVGGDEADTIEWKDIVAYDNTVPPLPPHGSSPPHPDNKISSPVAASGDAEKKKKKDVTNEKKKQHDDQATITGQVDGVEKTEDQDESSLDKKAANTVDVTKSVKPHPNLTTQTSLQSVRKPSFQPVGGVIWILGKKKKKPTSLLVEKMVTIDDQEEALHEYEMLSPSLMQSRATLLHDLQEDMAIHGAATAADEKEEETAKPPPCSLDEDEYAAVVAAETSRPIPAHRRAKSMSISSRSVRFPSNPITRQASRNSSVTFKLRPRSTKAPMEPPEEEEKPATTVEEAEMAKPPCSLDEEEYAAVVPAETETSRPIRAHRRAKSMSISNQSVWYPITRQASSKNSAVTSASTGGGRGIQLRVRSLRRRGLGGVDGGVFVMPAVALRHQKAVEKKKKSQMLYNDVIEETTSKLVKTRKSKVKALVGAFESVINKIAK